MPFGLYDAVVPAFRQTIGATAALVRKAETFCADQNLDPADIIQARLADDMLPFAYQVKSVAVHSLGAIEGCQKGSFSPDRSDPGNTFAALLEQLETAGSFLEQLRAQDVNDLLGQPMRIDIGKRYAEFTAEGFLLTFSKPNFYFHATTAYDILRARGMSIGKVDYLGPLKLQVAE